MFTMLEGKMVVIRRLRECGGPFGLIWLAWCFGLLRRLGGVLGGGKGRAVRLGGVSRLMRRRWLEVFLPVRSIILRVDFGE